jgi:hypothetical protein
MEGTIERMNEYDWDRDERQGVVVRKDASLTWDWN